MVKGDIRRKVEDVKPKTWMDIENICIMISNDRDACLIALLYLSGRRIGEVLHLQKQDFKIEPNRISFETFNEKTFRKKRVGNYAIMRKGVFYEKINPHWRTDTESGKALTIFVLNRLGYLSQKDYVFQKLVGTGHIEYGMGYRIVRFYAPDMWPHLFRHERFTEVFKIYKDDLLKAHDWTFHKRFDSNIPYIRSVEKEEEKI